MEEEITQRIGHAGLGVRLFGSFRKRVIWAVVLCTFGILAYFGWYHLLRRVPPAPLATDEERFKYGGLGTNHGFPLYVLEALPGLFADQMPAPGDWTAFGFTMEEGRDTPVGWAKRTVGFPGISFNCALCHSGSYRRSATDEPHLVLGAPAKAMDFGAFQDFLFACSEDPRFNASELLNEIEKTRSLSTSEKFAYRFAIIPSIKRWLKKERKKMSWTALRPPAGPGRQDAFNLLKIVLLDLPDDGSSATADILPLWHQEAREGLALHWNGSGREVREENLISTYSVLNGPKGFDAESFARLSAFLWTLPPPSYPFDTDALLAAKGKVLYDSHCASCHAPGSPGIGKVTAVKDVGTDPEYLSMMTPQFVDALRAVDDPPFTFTSVRITDGYVNLPLDGCWMRAPYLHNGSVPTLTDLLAPPDQRPARFIRGGNLYDPVKMGFDGGGPNPFEFDTTLRGNGNGGHTYGTDLEAAEKRALLEYLKTL